MTIEVFADAVSSTPSERFDWSGTIGDFVRGEGVDFDPMKDQAIAVIVDGEYISPTLWNSFDITDKDVKVKVVAHGFDPFTWAIIAVVAAVGVSLLMRPRIPGQNTQQQGRNLSSAEATGNVAKLNDVVPEIAGRFLRYPDYLTPPRRYFADQRTQYLETLLCVGPGQHSIDGSTVKIGNTPLSGLAGAEFHIYGPGASVSAHDMHWNWFSAPEVGGTSAGTAGLELSSDVVADMTPPSGTLAFSGTTITSSSGWADGVGVGTDIELSLPLTYTATSISVGEGSISEFTGNFAEMEPLAALKEATLIDGAAEYRVRILSFTGAAGSRAIRFQRATSDGEGGFFWSDLDVLPGTRTMTFKPLNRRYRITALAADVATVQAMVVNPFTGAVTPDAWVGFPSVTLAAAATGIKFVGGNVYGKWAGPYVACPSGEVSATFEVDTFFPSGLSHLASNGSLETVTVSVETQYRIVGTTSWTSVSNTYSAATLDQIGYTDRINAGSVGRYEFRRRRTTAVGADTGTNDKVQWYGMRTLLPSPTSYAGWTTIAMRIRGLGAISTSSENRLNLIATRMLPVLQSNGTWSGDQPTREISAFFRHITRSVGYTDAQMDVSELLRLQAIWNARGQTFDDVYDATTVRAALDVCLGAGMSDLTLADGILTPTLEDIRTTFDGPPFSAQNATTFVRQAFTFRRPDDNDGIQVEYIDENDGFVKKTVDCKLPGSLGVKLKKMTLRGVTNRTRAWRIGMRAAREIVYRRWAYTVETELSGLVARYNDYVPVIPDIPDFGQSAIIVGVSGLVIESGEILQWQTGQQHVVAWRNPNGSVSGPYNATRVSETKLSVPNGTTMPTTTLSMEPPHLYFGVLDKWCFPAIIKSVRPQNELRVQIQAVNYDARVYADDNNQPPE